MSLPQDPDGILVLEDGRSFPGWRRGSLRDAGGEVVFTTNLTGYQEVFTDPSYAGQIVVMTAPMIGNYGVSQRDAQSRRPWIEGVVMRELDHSREGWRAEGDLESWLEEEGIPALLGVDTRAVTRHVREVGAMRGVVVSRESGAETARKLAAGLPSMEGANLTRRVTTEAPYTVPAVGESRGQVACIDYGVKRRSLDLLAAAGYDVRVYPAHVPPHDLLASDPAGVFLSNGPGDPAAVEGAGATIRAVVDAGLPTFGICLGCQLIALAFGGCTYKLPYGHRGGNHPVRHHESGRVEITSQNHGFAIRGEDGHAAGVAELIVTHTNLNDGTIEGIRHAGKAVSGVQYHPEAAPGPHDSRHLFARFVREMSAT